jgi:hypothetical protein
MHTLRRALILLPLLVFGLVTTTSAAVFQSGETVSVTNPQSEDLFVSGEAVSITVPITGEVFVAGNTVTVSAPVERSLAVGGRSVTISGGVGYNTYAAGESVTLRGEFGNDVYAAGNTVTVEEGTVINGDLRIVGQNVIVNGTVGGDVFAGGQTVTSTATIGGNFRGGSENLTFAGGAIGGNLTYESDRDASGLDKVVITGSVERKSLEKTDPSQPWTSGTSAAAWLMAVLSSLALGALAIVLLPHKLVRIETKLTETWQNSLGYGVASFFLTPIVAIILCMTVIGIPLGLLLFLAYAALIILAMILLPIYVGRWLMRQAKTDPQWWIALVVGVLVLKVVELVPFVNVLVLFAVFIGLFLPIFGILVQPLLPEKKTTTN